MQLFIEKGLRGGTSMVTERFVKANNPYLSDYDRARPTSYIQYLDANNLYGWAVSQPLPTGEFEWLTKDEILSTDIEPIHPDSIKGYILEVDLEYPERLHNLHNAFPLVPETLIVPKEWMYPYQLKLLSHAPNTLTPNMRPPDWRAGALPTELTSPILAVSLFCQYLCSGGVSQKSVSLVVHYMMFIEKKSYPFTASSQVVL